MSIQAFITVDINVLYPNKSCQHLTISFKKSSVNIRMVQLSRPYATLSDFIVSSENISSRSITRHRKFA